MCNFYVADNSYQDVADNSYQDLSRITLFVCMYSLVKYSLVKYSLVKYSLVKLRSWWVCFWTFNDGKTKKLMSLFSSINLTKLKIGS